MMRPSRDPRTHLAVAVAALAVSLAVPAAAQTPATASIGEVENHRSIGATVFEMLGPDGTRAQVTFARNGKVISRTAIFALDGYPAGYDWTCADGSGSYTATVTNFDAAGAPVAGAERTVPFRIPIRPCRHRLAVSKQSRKAIRAGRTFRLRILDRWNTSDRALWMRACLRSKTNGESCRSFRARRTALTYRAPSTARRVTFTLSAPGEQTIETVRRRYRIVGARRPRPPTPRPQPKPLPAPDCSPSVCHALAVEATRKLARAIYLDDPDALDYGAHCRAQTRTRFDCLAWLSGVITHQLPGEGERYRCEYGVRTTIRGDTATAKRRTGAITPTNSHKDCYVSD